MVGMPKIPNSEEIASLTKEAMAPMAADIATIRDDIATIRDGLLRMVQLQEQAIALMGGVPAPQRFKPQHSHGAHSPNGISPRPSKISST
jgi:hypothetical protein